MRILHSQECIAILTAQYKDDIRFNGFVKIKTTYMEVLEVLKTIRNYILIAILAYGVYFVLDHHFIIGRQGLLFA